MTNIVALMYFKIPPRKDKGDDPIIVFCHRQICESTNNNNNNNNNNNEFFILRLGTNNIL